MDTPESEITTLPFPDAMSASPASHRSDDNASPDGEPDASYDAASMCGDSAHQCTAQAVAAQRKANQDGSNQDNACAHALACKAHQAAIEAMRAAGRDDEAAMHTALATEHDHQKHRAMLKHAQDGD
jgi:hypothetical protein